MWADRGGGGRLLSLELSLSNINDHSSLLLSSSLLLVVVVASSACPAAGEHHLVVIRSRMEGGGYARPFLASLGAIRCRRITSKDRPEPVERSTGEGAPKEAPENMVGDLGAGVLGQFHGINKTQTCTFLKTPTSFFSLAKSTGQTILMLVMIYVVGVGVMWVCGDGMSKWDIPMHQLCSVFEVEIAGERDIDVIK